MIREDGEADPGPLTQTVLRIINPHMEISRILEFPCSFGGCVFGDVQSHVLQPLTSDTVRRPFSTT